MMASDTETSGIGARSSLARPATFSPTRVKATPVPGDLPPTTGYADAENENRWAFEGMRPILGDLFFDRPFVGSTIVAMTSSGLVVFSRWAKPAYEPRKSRA